MFPAYVVAIFLALATLIYSVAGKYAERTEIMRDGRIRVEQTRIAEGLEAFRAEKGFLPASLDALVITPGYEHLRAYRNEWQRYALSGELSDGTWRYQRAATWTVKRKDGGVTYASENACGTGSVLLATSWCGMRDGVWHRLETREWFADEIAQEKIRQRRTLQLFADYWTAKQQFPRIGNNGASLGVGQLSSLAQLVGYTGTADSCTGIYSWAGIPLDCSALFDVWGNPVGYQYQGVNFMILASEAPFSSAAGNRVIVASPLQIQG